jgi:putative membrane protein
MWHWGGFGWMFGGIFGILVLIGIILLILWAVRRGGGWQGGAGWSPGQPRTRDALDIARERYARGEISQSEFLEIKKNLQ